jgi:hypothetical protein
MDWLSFGLHYLIDLWWSWAGLVATGLGFLDVAVYVAGREWDTPRQYRLPILVTLVFVAQFEAYLALNAKEAETAKEAATTVEKLKAEISNGNAKVADLERQLQIKTEQVDQLRSAAVRAPVPVDVRVREVPPVGLLPSYILSDQALSTYWRDQEEWTNPRDSFKEVVVDWDAVPADVIALAELKVSVVSNGDGWGEVRLIDTTDNTVVAAGERVVAQHDFKAAPFKENLPVKQATGRRHYMLQIRCSPNAEINVRGDLVFVRKARWG